MSPLLKVGLRYGLVASVMVVALYSVSLAAGLSPIQMMSLPISAADVATFLVMPTFIILAIAEFKRYRSPGGQLAFWQGMTIGLWPWLAGAVVSAIFLAVLLSVQPEAWENYVQVRVDRLLGMREQTIQSVGIEEYERALKTTKAVQPSDIVWGDLLMKAFVGFLVASVVSVVLRKKELAPPKP